MEEVIEEEIQSRFDKNKIKINVDYESIRTYKITITIKHMPIETGITIKHIVFTYDWFNNYTYSSNIEQLYYEIKNILIKENIKYD